MININLINENVIQEVIQEVSFRGRCSVFDKRVV